MKMFVQIEGTFLSIERHKFESGMTQIKWAIAHLAADTAND